MTAMYKIIFATGNEGKMKEIREILDGLTFLGEKVQILSMKEAGIDIDIIEDGTTFEENAMIKARADDSGLVIDYLNGEPGIYSARYLGKGTSYRVKNANLVQRLEGVPDEKRSARFVCAIAAVLPDGRELSTRGTIEGRIGYEEKGLNGFGFDPIFYVPEIGKYTAELSDEDKNRISHRGKALRAMREELEKELEKKLG